MAFSADGLDPGALYQRAEEIRLLDARQALAFCEAGLAAARLRNNPAEIARGLLDSSQCLIFLTEYAEAERLAGEAADGMAALGDEIGECKALNAVGNAVWRQGRLEEARDRFRQSLAIGERCGDLQRQLAASNNLGNVASDLGDYAGALRGYETSLELSRRVGRHDTELTALTNIIQLYADLGEYERALESYQQAQQLPQPGDHYQRAVVLLSLSHIYDRMGDAENARTALAEGLVCSRKLGDRNLEARVLLEQAKLDDAQGRGDAAARRYGDILLIQREIGDRSGQLEALLALADAGSRAGAFAAAHEHFDAAFALAGEIGQRAKRLQARMGRATLAEREGAPAGMEEYAAIHGEAESLGSRELRLEATRLLSGACERLGRPGPALEHYRRAHLLEKEIHNESAGRRLRQITARHQLELSRREAETERQHRAVLERENQMLARLNTDLQNANLEKGVLLLEVQRLAMEDGLTGLANRRQFDARLREECERAVRYSRPLSLAIIDLDRFKQVNDRFGHPTGDAVLRTVSALLRENVRQTDLIARYGGEELAVLLTETPLPGALEICQRICAAIAKHDWKALTPGLNVTVSIGVAQVDGLADSQALVAAADARLYEAKNHGRNRVAG